MKKINYADAKQDDTLYRYRIAAGQFYAVTLHKKDKHVVISTIKPDADMAILTNIPAGTQIATI